MKRQNKHENTRKNNLSSFPKIGQLLLTLWWLETAPSNHCLWVESRPVCLAKHLPILYWNSFLVTVKTLTWVIVNVKTFSYINRFPESIGENALTQQAPFSKTSFKCWFFIWNENFECNFENTNQCSQVIAFLVPFKQKFQLKQKKKIQIQIQNKTKNHLRRQIYLSNPYHVFYGLKTIFTILIPFSFSFFFFFLFIFFFSFFF